MRKTAEKLILCWLLFCGPARAWASSCCTALGGRGVLWEHWSVRGWTQSKWHQFEAGVGER